MGAEQWWHRCRITIVNHKLNSVGLFRSKLLAQLQRTDGANSSIAGCACAMGDRGDGSLRIFPKRPRKSSWVDSFHQLHPWCWSGPLQDHCRIRAIAAEIRSNDPLGYGCWDVRRKISFTQSCYRHPNPRFNPVLATRSIRTCCPRQVPVALMYLCQKYHTISTWISDNISERCTVNECLLPGRGAHSRIRDQESIPSHRQRF